MLVINTSLEFMVKCILRKKSFSPQLWKKKLSSRNLKKNEGGAGQ